MSSLVFFQFGFGNEFFWTQITQKRTNSRMNWQFIVWFVLSFEDFLINLRVKMFFQCSGSQKHLTTFRTHIVFFQLKCSQCVLWGKLFWWISLGTGRTGMTYLIPDHYWTHDFGTRFWAWKITDKTDTERVSPLDLNGFWLNVETNLKDF